MSSMMPSPFPESRRQTSQKLNPKTPQPENPQPQPSKPQGRPPEIWGRVGRDGRSGCVYNYIPNLKLKENHVSMAYGLPIRLARDPYSLNSSLYVPHQDPKP